MGRAGWPRTLLCAAFAIALAGCGDDDGGVQVGAWTLGFGGTGTDQPNAVAAGNGAVVLAGLFSDTVSVGDLEVTAANAYDVFAMAVDPDGSPRWVQRFGGQGNDIAHAVAVDADGSAVVVGSFSEKLDVADETFSTGGGQDIFVVRLGPNGEPVWAKAFGGAGDDIALAVTISGDSIFIAGEFSVTAGFDDMIVQSEGETDAFFAALDGDGAVLWVSASGGKGFDSATALAPLPDGGFAATGTFEEAIHLGDQEVVSKGLFDVFVAGFDGDGKARWARSFGDARDDFGRAIAADAGVVAVAGEFEGTIDFGAGEVTSGGYDAFVVQLGDADGATQWAHALAGESRSTGQAVAVAPDGDVTFGGGFADAASVGAATITGAGLSDVAALKVDPAGDVIWLQRFGGAADDGATAVAIDSTGAPIVAGFFNGTGNFAHGVLTSAGQRDVFALSLPGQ